MKHLVVVLFIIGVFGAFFVGQVPTVNAQQTDLSSVNKKLQQDFLKAKRIVFAGDSITYDGEFLVWLEASLLEAKVATMPELLNMGLPSETCCGLTENTHPFPRPNVQERIERLLKRSKPDILVANYGINDGIYHPAADERFAAFKKGIDQLIEVAKKHDVKIVLVTPPPFDPVPQRKSGRLKKRDSKRFDWGNIYENYDSEVLAVYSDWLLSQSDRVLGVIDIRTPMLNHYQTQREKDPEFVMSKDGVHINAEGHRIIAEAIAKAIGVEPATTISDQVLNLIRERNRVLRDAWVSHVGHLRPRVRAGKPLVDAEAQAKKINQQLQTALNSKEK